MGTVVGRIEFDAKARQVIVGGIEFDVRSRGVIVGFVEFDVRAPLAARLDGGGLGAHRSTRQHTSISSPQPTPKRYHDDSYEQERARMAAELADEEIVLAFLMEIALHV